MEIKTIKIILNQKNGFSTELWKILRIPENINIKNIAFHFIKMEREYEYAKKTPYKNE